MIESHELKNRDPYVKKLISFQDTEPVKIITGIRRCGKSSLLKLMIRHLRETGIQQEQVVEMNFESHDFRSMTSDEVYHYVKEKAVPDKRMYLFFDELQRINAWEDAVNSFRVDLGLRHLCHRFQRLPAILRIFHLSLRPLRGDQNVAALIQGVSGFPQL